MRYSDFLRRVGEVEVSAVWAYNKGGCNRGLFEIENIVVGRY